MYYYNHAQIRACTKWWIITMKLTIFFIIFFSFQAAADAFSQKIRLQVKDQSLHRVLQEIREQTGFAFLMDRRQLQDARPVTVTIDDLDLSEALPMIFKDQPLDYEVSGQVILINPKKVNSESVLGHSSLVLAYAEVRGRVADSLGNPLVGATVRVLDASGKRTNLQAATDGDGRFVLQNVPESFQLEISFVGYRTRRVTSDRVNQGAIILQAIPANLEAVEVMVNTGYQTLPKERATGSFDYIDANLLQRSVSMDILSRLEGIASSFSYELPRTTSNREPSTTPNLRIRGLSTIEGETEPLIVVDNFPYEGNINHINPNDIESVTILKDAAAASIWGARAGNGVIVITTKRGTISRKPIINVNSSLSIAERPDLYYSPMLLPASDAIDLERTLFNRGVYGNKNDWTAYSPAVEIFFALKEDLIDEATAASRLAALNRYGIREQAQRYLYRESIKQQHAMDVSGGSENHLYFLSAGWDNNKNSLRGERFERITLNAKNEFRPISQLTVSTSVNYLIGRTFDNGISMAELSPRGMSSIYSYARIADENGAALPLVKNNRFTYTEGATELGLLDWHYRPLDELLLNDNSLNTQEIRLNTAMNYQFLKGLHAELRYQYQRQGNASTKHFAEESYFARNLINSYTQSDGSRPIPLGGVLDKSSSHFTSHYGRFQLNYNRLWSERHQLHGLAGFELREEQNVGGGSFRLYGFDDDVASYATNLDYHSSFQLRPNASNWIPSNISAGNSIIDRFVSYYANLGYTANNKYIFSGSIRWDASNIFGVAFNQKGVPLWSVGAAWNATEEPFINLSWVNLLKLRATYGANGNVVRTLSALPVIEFGHTNSASRIPSARLTSVGNPDLSWEKVSSLNLGLDFALLSRRVSGALEWYSKQSSNLIGNDFIDPTTGIVTSRTGSTNMIHTRNYANMSTQGVDFELITINLQSAIRWETNILLNYVHNKVTNYRGRTNIPIADYFSEYPIPGIAIEGDPKDQIYALPWHGLDGTGAPLVMVDNALGTEYNTFFNNLSPHDLDKVGVSVPPYFGSIRNTFSWRGWSASLNLLWKAGHKVRRESIAYDLLFSSGTATHTDYLQRWKQPGDELLTNVPSMPANTNLRRDQAYLFSTALIERGDFIRLQDVNLSYQLPQKAMHAIGLQQVTLYGYVRNLGIIWKHTNERLDPDVRALYPQPLQVSFGLQIKI